MQRRDFFKFSLVTSTLVLSDSELTAQTEQPIDSRVRNSITFPQKRALIVHSDRPPLLETPRDAFTTAITPNNELFVRWHMPMIPTSFDLDTYYIHVHGEVKKRLYLTVEALKRDFEAVEVTVAMQCGGNSRSAFHPTTSGIQWGSGAMGCSIYKGVRLKDVLERAGLLPDAEWITLNGNDKSVMTKIESFKRELKIDTISDDTIIAYEQNGEDLPFLNGFPVRLIIPGFYADSWVKMLSNITVTKKYQNYYYMDKAYRVPDNRSESETPQKLFHKTKPLEDMNVKSFIGYPTSTARYTLHTALTIKGIAFDSGSGIASVEISFDGGKTWDKALLGEELSPYAFRTFTYTVKLQKRGALNIMAKATNNRGESQPFANAIAWNHGGYKFNGIDSVTIDVV